MVLDTRNLHEDDDHPRSGDGAKAKRPSSQPDPGSDKAGVVGGNGPEEERRLEALIDEASNAVHMRERAEMIAALRSLVPGKKGIELLCDIVETEADPRRLIAAQMLGYHRQWLGDKAAVERVLSWASAERDPKVGAALMWILRGHEEVQSFLRHSMLSMAREAAIGFPLTASTLPSLIHALFVGRAPDLDRVLLEKLRTIGVELVPRVIDLVLAMDALPQDEELLSLFASLPQAPLFEMFIAGRGAPHFDVQQTEAEAARATMWHQVARIAENTLRRSPDAELIRYLVNRSARDDAFARRHASFVKAAVTNTDAIFGAEIIDDLERLTQGASEERLLRMAEMLVDLSAKLEQSQQAEALLDEWKRTSPDLKLKIYHLEQGL